jgi:TIR domain
MAFKVFFSYTHKDEQLLEKLKEHLAPLKNQGLIDGGWHDRDISAGTEWEHQIVRHLETADIILLLVSAAFMNSDYCYGKELQQAIKRHERKEARVIPIILSPVDWEISPLDRLQALPTDAKPVTGARWHSVDEALLNVVKGIRAAIKDLQKHPSSNTSYRYQYTYITEQTNQGTSALAALYQCDPELGKFFDWIASSAPKWETAIPQTRLEKLLQEVSAVGDGDLRVQAEVTPDTFGVMADSFNYIIEELAKLVARTRKTTTQAINSSTNALKFIEEQKHIASMLSQQLDVLMKSLPEGIQTQQTFPIQMLLPELFKSVDLIEQEINKIGEGSHQLHTSASTFTLPESLSE